MGVLLGNIDPCVTSVLLKQRLLQFTSLKSQFSNYRAQLDPDERSQLVFVALLPLTHQFHDQFSRKTQSKIMLFDTGPEKRFLSPFSPSVRLNLF